MSNLFFKITLLIFSAIFLISCGNKNEQAGEKKQTDNKSSLQNSDLVAKDDKGVKVSLVLKPKKGDVFKYKMNAKTTSKEKSPLTADKEVTSTQDIDYFYSEEVNDVSSAGIITYKIKFDSIAIKSTAASSDSSMSMSYNSNVKDSNYSKPDFIQYNAIMNEEFFIRVSPQGEITDIYGMEKVLENMFKALGDTLSLEQKESLKDSFGRDAIQAVLQQQFQMFPKTDVYKDSTWTRSYETQILIFPVKNILSYNLKDYKDEGGQIMLTIDADLAVEFIRKDIKEKNMSYKVEDAKTGGKGIINFNLSKGCVTTKETNTNIDLQLRLSAGGQSVKTTQTVSTELRVTLLQ